MLRSRDVEVLNPSPTSQAVLKGYLASFRYSVLSPLESFPRFCATLRGLGDLSFLQACQHTILDFSEDFLEFAVLANYALVLPVSNVPCERGFSLQNRIKTLARSCLSDRSVDYLMLLAMEAPDFKSPAATQLLEKAAGRFAGLRDRRTTHF